MCFRGPAGHARCGMWAQSFQLQRCNGGLPGGPSGWVVIFGAFFSGANFWCLSIKRVILEEMKWWRIKHAGQIVGRERCDTSSHLFSRARRNKENNMFTLVCLKMRVLPLCPQTLFLIETNMINLPAYDEDFHHHCIVVEVPKLPHKWFRGMTLLADRLYSGWLSWATCSPSDSVELSKMAMKRERERESGWMESGYPIPSAMENHHFWWVNPL